MRSDVRRRRDPAFWLAINKILMALVVVGLVCMVTLWFYPELELRNKMARELEVKKAELASEQLLRKQREREVYLLENDREYIETIARDKLELMKPGETIFRLGDEEKPAKSM